MIKVKRFTAKWCQPCHQLAPVFSELEKLFPNIEFQTIDVDTAPEEVQENSITNVPTVIFIKDNITKQRFTGLQPKSTYVDIINSLI